jgi:hypothetical protein
MSQSKEQMLTLSPFSVVMMMSMVGGNAESLDRGAILLGQLIDKEFEVKSPLLSSKIDQLPQEMEQLGKMIQAGALEILAPLGVVRDILDEKYPEEAVGFCEGLMDLARLSASSLDPNGNGELNQQQEKSMKVLEVMLLDIDPEARKDIAKVLAMICAG